MSASKTITVQNKALAHDDVKDEPDTIRCYLDVAIILRTRRTLLSGDRLLAAQALSLMIRLDAELREARADWNQDRFRRIMRARSQAALRVLRRWSKLNPAPSIPPGNLRRRYHANLAGNLYQASE